jgi:glycine/D-amino acid oxidase-like deaminating enzyme
LLGFFISYFITLKNSFELVLKMDIDYLIIGQGISGTFLSFYLRQLGQKIIVIDKEQPFTASKVASGVINPVTGRRIVRTWRIEELLPFAELAYKQLEEIVGAKLVKKCSLIDFHPNSQMKEAFEKRLPEELLFLHELELPLGNHFNFYYGHGEISPCLLVDLNLTISRWRSILQKENLLLNEEFRVEECIATNEQIAYKNITAKKIIFCDGVGGVSNPYFKNLPYSPNKGEAIIAQIPGLSTDYIYKHGISMVPWKEDLFWIGSTYEWNFVDTAPTAAFKEKVVNILNNWLKLPFKIVDHIASVRPANMERRPFVGLHPTVPSVGILNGMGTKGCSLAPFFAKQLAAHLVNSEAIYADADVKRFAKTLARVMN